MSNLVLTPPVDYSKDYVNAYVMSNIANLSANGGINSIQELESLPGKYKKYTFNYPVIEVGQITIRAHNLNSAIRQAQKKIDKTYQFNQDYYNQRNMRGVWKFHKLRNGPFELVKITITNFKDKLSNWGNHHCGINHLAYNKIDNHHCTFTLSVNHLSIPDQPQP